MTVASTTSKVTYTGNGSTRQWPFKFTVLNTDHLKVIITDPDGAETTLTDGYEISLTQGVVQYPKKASDPALKSGYKITLIRETPIVQNVDLINQGNYDAETLEREYDYLTLCVQEVADKAERAVKIPASSDTDPDELINSISESVSTAKSAADSATASAESASNSADQAGTSASAAATSEANAATSETNAKASADSATASASAAATSETNAATSETNAKTSADNAATSEANAKTSADNAATSEANAKTSADNAATSEANAKTSADNAAQSAQEAAASAANAANKVDSVILTNATQSAAGYMSAEDKKNLEALLADKTWYKRPSLMTPNKTTVTIPAGMQVAINGALYVTTAATTLALGDFVTAANRKGKDVYVYACVPSSGTAPTFVLSLNSTVPTGYTAATSRKIGGFHCLCVDVGTISGHTLSGYVAGDILPASVWDLLFRAEAENEGMVFINGHWYDIYLPSWELNKLQSVYGGTIVDGVSAMPMHGERFAEYAGLVSKRLICRDEFLVIAKGSNERTNIANSVDPGTTGGHKDTAGRRMISNYGLEDCCGAMWQWTRDIWGAFNVLSTSYSNQGGINATAQTSEAAGGHWLNGYYWQADGRGTSNIDIDGSASLYGNAYGALGRAIVGGYWNDGSNCGSRSVPLSNLSTNRNDGYSSRLASEPRVVNL